MSEDTYKTIVAPSEGIYTEKRSKFIAIALPVRTVEEVNGLKSGLNVLGTLGNPNSTGYHFDYGFPAICMIVRPYSTINATLKNGCCAASLLHTLLLA